MFEVLLAAAISVALGLVVWGVIVAERRFLG